MQITELWPELFVSDVDAAVRFFCEDLGFECAFDAKEEDGAREFAVLQTGPWSLTVHRMLQERQAGEARTVRLNIRVDDIHGMREQLMEKGHHVSEIEDVGEGELVCSLEGPDAYRIVLVGEGDAA